MDNNELKVVNSECVPCEDNDLIEIADVFPVIELTETELSSAKKIPIASLGALGAAFAQIPETARTIVTTQKSSVAMKETLFVGINPKGVAGFLSYKDQATNGNIMRINEQGKQVVAARMKFKPINELPVENATKTVMPYNPTMMVVAVAMYSVEKKLDGIRSSIDNVLGFLKKERQAEQRGCLRQLEEIAEEYKRKGNDSELCKHRNIIVQQIKLKSMGNIELYGREISEELACLKALENKKNSLLNKDAGKHIDKIREDFSEYQLACCLYAYCNFLDVVLRKDFEEDTINDCRNKIESAMKQYSALYTECHAQIATYQRSSIENKVLGGIGKTADRLGTAIGNIPIVEKGPVDEMLIDAGQLIKDVNKNAVKAKVSAIELLEDAHMGDFLDAIETVGAIYNNKKRMVIDGTNLYVIDTETVA